MPLNSASSSRDRTTAFVDAATAVLEPWIKNVREGVEEMVAIMDRMIPGNVAPEITIEQAAVVKRFADVYLMGVIDRDAIRRRDATRPGEADDARVADAV